MKPIWMLSAIAALVLGALTFGTGGADTTAPVARIEDFDWLAGHWLGRAGDTDLEQICTHPHRGQIMCMVRFADAKAVTGMELVTLEENAGDMEEHIRFFTPGLGEKEGAKTLVLRLSKFSPSESVLENLDGKSTGARSVTLTRVSKDEIGVHIRVVGEDGKERFIDALWKRAED